MKDILITGADGMVGSYIDFGIRLTRDALDVTDLKAVMTACKKHQPRTIIHLAAVTDLAQCEQNPSHTYFINAVGTYNVALAARTIGSKLVYVSTSGVFDGTKKEPYTEADIPNPPNVYGHSKYLGELVVRSILDDFLIVRTAWIFGGGAEKDMKFVGKILQQSGAKEVRAVTDKRGSPTYARDLVAAISRLIAEDKKGIFHLSNEGSATRYDVVKEILSLTGAQTIIVPTTSADFPLVYASGANESMVSKVPYMRFWQEALKEYIEIEWGNAIVTSV